MINETLARLALDSSGYAYQLTPGLLTGYTPPTVIRGYDGFSALIYRKLADPSQAVVAFGGTGSLADAYADVHLGTNQWRNNGQAVLDALGGDNTHVLFAGHSLGGALAQYAAYEYLAPEKRNSQEGVSVVTFNGLGGLTGAQLMHRDDYDPHRLSGVAGAHIAERKDVVARLGNGHLGGEVIRHDLNSAHALAAHQLSTSFAGAEHEGLALLSGVRNDPTFSYLNVDNGQRIASVLAATANLPLSSMVTPSEAMTGLMRAMGGVLLVSPREELNELGNAILPNHAISDWGDIRQRLGPPALVVGELLHENGPLAQETARAMLRQQVADALIGIVSHTDDIEAAIHGVQATGDAIRDIFDHAHHVANNASNAIRESAESLYLESVAGASRAIEALSKAFQQAEDFGAEKIERAQSLYDQAATWTGRQLSELTGRLERTQEVIVTGADDFIQEWYEGYEAARLAGLESAAAFLGDGLQSLVRIADAASELVGEVSHELPEYIVALKNQFQSLFGVIPTISPLVVDLDFDGLELSSLRDSELRFDLDVDGYAEHTGWVHPDDGLLGLDRNGNGRLDDGGELFGNHTGESRENLAENGFDALRVFDGNHDGNIDTLDGIYNQLRIWRDLDQDAVSHPDELFNLADLGIESIPTSAQVDTRTVAQHRIALVSNVTHANGQESLIGDVFFQVDPTNTRRIGRREVNLEAMSSANLRGYGLVEDLQLAAARDPILHELVHLITTTPLQEVTALPPQIDRLIYRWTGTDTIDPSGRGAFDARKLTAMERILATDFRSTDGTANSSGLHTAGLHDAWRSLQSAVLVRVVTQHQQNPLSLHYDFALDEVSTTLTLSELIEQAVTTQPSQHTEAVSYWHKIASTLTAMAPFFSTPTEHVRGVLDERLGESQVGPFIDRIFADHIGGTEGNDILYTPPGENLVTGGAGEDVLIGSSGGADTLFGGAGDDELRSYLHLAAASQFIGGTGNDRLIGSRYRDDYFFSLGDGQDLIDETAGGFQSTGAPDRLIFDAGITPEQVTVKRHGSDLQFQISTGQDQVTVKDWYSYPGVAGRDKRIETVVFHSGEHWDVDEIHQIGLTVHGDAGDNDLSGLSRENNVLLGHEGNDILRAAAFGDDQLFGGDGDDLLFGSHNGIDVLWGGPGNDILQSYATLAAASQFHGETGNDRLVGSRYADDYHFNRGDGIDTIDETAGGFGAGKHPDRLLLGTGISPAEVRVEREDMDLRLLIGETGDQVHVINWYNYAGTNGKDKRLEAVLFATGETWSVEYLHEQGLTKHGTDGNDQISGLHREDNTLYGHGGNDVLHAGTYGNDVLYAGPGDDSLFGGAASVDRLYGGEGNDTLQSHRTLAAAAQFFGGPGDDILVGSRYADDYFFERGDGHDLIDETAGGLVAATYPDRLFFGNHIKAEDIEVHTVGDNLAFSIDQNNQVTVRNWFRYAGVNGKDKRLEKVQFADGTVWDSEYIESVAVSPTHGVTTLSHASSSIESQALLLAQTPLSGAYSLPLASNPPLNEEQALSIMAPS